MSPPKYNFLANHQDPEVLTPRSTLEHLHSIGGISLGGKVTSWGLGLSGVASLQGWKALEDISPILGPRGESRCGVRKQAVTSAGALASGVGSKLSHPPTGCMGPAELWSI